jgi:hypothetical protein
VLVRLCQVLQLGSRLLHALSQRQSPLRLENRGGLQASLDFFFCFFFFFIGRSFRLA